MNKHGLPFLKGILGLILFYVIQIGFQLVFLNILLKKNFIVNNILFLIMELILVSVCLLMNYKKLKNDYDDFNTNYKKYLKLGFKYWLIGLMVMAISNLVITSITGGLASNETSVRESLKEYPIYMIFSNILFAPFVEELTFRGNFKEAFKSNIVFIIFTALLFSGVHVLNGISNPLELLYFIPYGALAISFGITYTKTNNIYTTMVLHSFHNTLSIVLMILTTL